jgi:glycosyltransferase involved in cell wall biosynthesis
MLTMLDRARRRDLNRGHGGTWSDAVWKGPEAGSYCRRYRCAGMAARSDVEDSPDEGLAVSVLVPAHQAERYLEETLRSALAQTVSAIEIIVIDDGSTDATTAIAERLAATDNRVRLIRQPNRGVAAARNRGLAEARGRWAALLDHDDIWLPTRLERQLAFLERNRDVAVLGTYGWHIGPDGRRTGVFDVGPRSREQFAQLRDEGAVIYLLASSALMDIAVVHGVGGFREDYQPAEDVDLWTRVADNHVVLVLPERLVEYRVHYSSVSMQHFFVQKEQQVRIARNAGLRRSGRREMSLDELRRRLRSEPLAARLARGREWRSQFWYRKAGLRLAAGDARGALWLTAAFVLAPEIVLGRLRRQVLPLARAFRARRRSGRRA